MGRLQDWSQNMSFGGGAVPRAVREALVCWEHSTPYALPTFRDFSATGAGNGFQKTFDLAKEHSFLCDHVVDGRILMPVRRCLSICHPKIRFDMSCPVAWRHASIRYSCTLINKTGGLTSSWARES
jgi:hypothetical protein